jgi:hypothetical protein
VLLRLMGQQQQQHSPALVEHRYITTGAITQSTGRGQPHQRPVVVTGIRHHTDYLAVLRYQPCEFPPVAVCLT